MVKNPRANAGNAGDVDLIPGSGMAIHSSLSAQETPWTEKPGRLQSMGSQKAEHDLAAEHMLRPVTPNRDLPWLSMVLALPKMGEKRFKNQSISNLLMGTSGVIYVVDILPCREESNLTIPTLPSTTSLFPLPSGSKNLSFCTAPQSSSTSKIGCSPT